MRLELAERMRCPRPHAATPLIVVARRAVERDLQEGFAGCPVCQLEARVHEGDVIFPDAPARRADASLGVDLRIERANDASGVATGDASLDATTRLLALLGLAEPGGAVLLTGAYASLSDALAAAVDVAVVTLNSPAGVRGGASAAAWLAEEAVPFTDGTFRGIALSADTPAATVTDAVRALAVGGRLLGAVELAQPLGVRELARDAAEWVAEREAGPSGVIALRRAER